MDFETGLVVRSKAGHDKGEFFVILQTETNYALICDGKRRKLQKPKKKKFIHLAVTNTKLTDDKLSTDKKIRTELKRFNNK